MAVPPHIAARIVDPDAYADGSIHDVYAWLRANDPLGLIETPTHDAFRVVTRHADIMEISRQNALFINGPDSILFDATRMAQARAMNGGQPVIKSLIHMDAPDHLRHRMLTQAWFQPKNIRRLEGDLRTLAKTAVDRMAATGGRCDFVTEIALHYPLHVIMSILGVPETDEPMMLQLTQDLFGASVAARPGEEVKVDMTAVMTMMAYFNDLTAQRRRTPTDDLASVIANGEVMGAPLSDLAMMGYYFIIATAGHDTTSSSIAGALWALAENPGEFARVKEDPSLIPGMIDEAIRWITPVKHFMRTVTQDTQIGGQALRAGEWLMLCYASANRDEAVFDTPDAFRVDRKANHIAFGYGAHLCIGQHLARMEMRILFEELIPRLDSLAFDGAPEMTGSIFVNGPKRLPVRFTMAG